MERELRAQSEKHWHLAVEQLDKLEAAFIEIYDAGAEDPIAIDLLDQVVSIIRRKDKSADDRVREIDKLMRGWQERRRG